MLVIIGEKSRATAAAKENICLKCRNYFAFQYSDNDQKTHMCTLWGTSKPIILKGPVSSCTDFSDTSQPFKSDMEKIAWTIESSKRTTGFHADVRFIPPKKRDGDL